MKIHTLTEHRVFVTPQQLRKIADEMENEMPKRIIGQDCPSHSWFGENGTTIKLIADQEKYHNHKEGKAFFWS